MEKYWCVITFNGSLIGGILKMTEKEIKKYLKENENYNVQIFEKEEEALEFAYSMY